MGEFATRDSNAITELLDYAREAAKWAGEDTLKWFAYVQTHKSDTNPGGAKYRYVSKPEIRWTSLSALAHGAMGVLYYMFDAVVSGQTDYGIWDTSGGGTNPDSSEVMLAGAVEALERLDEVAWALKDHSYEYSASDSGYDYNVTISGTDTSWTVFGNGGKGWLIQQITSGDWSDGKNWVEVCRWKKESGDECYVLLPRDTYSSHDVTVTFTGGSDRDCDINGHYQGAGTSVSLTIPKGDCAVLRLY